MARNVSAKPDPHCERCGAADAAGIPRDDVEATVDLVVEGSVVAEELDTRSAGSAGVGDQRADSCVRVGGREPCQRQRDRWAGRVGGVEGDVEGAALQSVAAVLPSQRRRRVHGGRRGREEPFDLGDGDVGAVELDVVAGVVDGDEARGRRQRQPVLLPAVPHVVESRCLDRVETRERVLGCGHDAERQRSEGVDRGDLGEAGDLVEVLGVVGRVGRVGAAGDEAGGRLGAVIGHGATGRVPCRRRRVEQDQPIDLVRVARREGHGLGAAVGVADDHVWPGLTDVAQEGVEVARRRGERLGCGRRVAGRRSRSGRRSTLGLVGRGRARCDPSCRRRR